MRWMAWAVVLVLATAGGLRAEPAERKGLTDQELEALLTRQIKREAALANLPRPGNQGPRPDMRGSVKAVDDLLLTVSIGSDNGLREGHTLKVFRLEPEAVFLGTLTISAVRAKEAVGTFEPAAGAKKNRPKSGDQVATKVQ